MCSILYSLNHSDTTKNESDKSKQILYSSGSSVLGLGTKTLDSGLFICEDWVLSIDFKLANQSTKNWNNLFGLQVGPWTPLNHKFVDFGNADRTAGSHILSVWVRIDKSTVMIMIKSNLNYNPNFIYNTTTKFDPDNWINLKGIVRDCFSRPVVNQSKRNFCNLFFMINVEKNGEPIF